MNERYDGIIVSLFFLSLLPIRLAFISLVGNNWIGSVGIITAVSVPVLYFTHKGKLGKFGSIFLRYFSKRHRKKKIIVVVGMLLSISFNSLFIYGVHYAEGKFSSEKEIIHTVLKNQNVSNLNDLAVETLAKKPIIDVIVESLGAFIVLFMALIVNFDLFSLVVYESNLMTDGWLLNISTVTLVEVIEMFGIFIIYNKFMKKPVNP